MNRFQTQLATVALLLWSAGALAQSGIPDLPNCQAWTAYDGEAVPTLCVHPDGGGPPFTESQLPDGTVVDATVYLLIRDGLDNPIAFYPREDLWLESADGGLVLCLGGGIADVDTDQTGTTYWSEPMQGGGFSQAQTLVMVSGDSVWSEGLNLSFNSPDLDGNGLVDLVDLVPFAHDLFNAYHFRSDLFRDGAINLADVAVMARGFGSSCQ